MLATLEDERRHREYMDKEDAMFPDLKLPLVPVRNPFSKITNIGITTTARVFDFGPMKEAVYFHRGTDTCRQYLLNANRESFFRCVRAMRRLAVRKWMDKGV